MDFILHALKRKCNFIIGLPYLSNYWKYWLGRDERFTNKKEEGILTSTG